MSKETINNVLAHGSEPILILAISNGAGHLRAAEATAEAIRAGGGSAVVIDVADYMIWAARFTHVTAYLWLVKHTPQVWDLIDRFQKRQSQTSPDWYYRRGCAPLFELARCLQPKAIVATEVGCCEIAALIKKDLKLDVPLVAINVNYDADLAWVRPEVDLYCVATEQVRTELITFGAAESRIAVWGVPMSPDFGSLTKANARAEVCEWLNLDPDQGLVLVAGGSEGMGQIERVTLRLMLLESVQTIVVTGKNQRLQHSLQNQANGNRDRIRVLGWTNRFAQIMRASDVMVSKLGNTFDEAIAAELPIVALKPPPGSERVQYELLNQWHVGFAVRTVDDVVATVGRLMRNSSELVPMRASARRRRLIDAGDRVAAWLKTECDATKRTTARAARSAMVG